jgi:hypothetical protein
MGESRADGGGRWRRQSASPRRRWRFIDGESTREEGCPERCKRRSRGSGSAYIGEGRERNQRPARRNAINGQGTGGFDLNSMGALKRGKRKEIKERGGSGASVCIQEEV